MNNLEILGLEESKVNAVRKGLAQLLADFQIYYTNLRNLHWNVKGHGFFILHAKYEELYNDAAGKVDEIAERLLQLGSIPESKFSEYLKIATIKELNEVECGQEGMKDILGYFKNLIAQERKLINFATAFTLMVILNKSEQHPNSLLLCCNVTSHKVSSNIIVSIVS